MPFTVQTMAKTSGSKVIFVPMQLQSDVVGQLANHPSASGSAAILSNEGNEGGAGGVTRAGLLNSLSQI